MYGYLETWNKYFIVRIIFICNMFLWSLKMFQLKEIIFSLLIFIMMCFLIHPIKFEGEI